MPKVERLISVHGSAVCGSLWKTAAGQEWERITRGPKIWQVNETEKASAGGADAVSFRRDTSAPAGHADDFRIPGAAVPELEKNEIGMAESQFRWTGRSVVED